MSKVLEGKGYLRQKKRKNIDFDTLGNRWAFTMAIEYNPTLGELSDQLNLFGRKPSLSGFFFWGGVIHSYYNLFIL